LHIDDNELFMRYCRFRGDIVVFLVYLVWDIVADFKIVGVKKNGICMCWCYHSSARTPVQNGTNLKIIRNISKKQI